MSTNVTNLIQKVLGDGARTTKFDVAFQFTNPSIFPSSSNVAVMVKSTTFPSKAHQVIDFKYKGRTIPIRGQAKYTNTWECTFYLPENHEIKKGFETWIDALDEQVYFSENPTSQETQTRSIHSSQGYTKDIAIYQLDFQGTNQVARYTLYNVFPVEVQPVQVQMDPPGNVEELTVTFSYSHYQMETMKGVSGAFMDELVAKVQSELYGAGSSILQALGEEITGFLSNVGLTGAMEGASDLKQTVLNNLSLEQSTEYITQLIHGYNPLYPITPFVSQGVSLLKGIVSDISDTAKSLFNTATESASDALTDLSPFSNNMRKK